MTPGRRVGRIGLTIILILTGACAGDDPVLPDTSGSGVSPSTSSRAAPTTAAHPTTTPDLPVFEPVLDPAIAPAHTLPSFDGQPRPVGAVSGPDGIIAEFASAELVVFGDLAVASEVAARYRGQILRSTNPAKVGIEAAVFHLVRIDPTTADPGVLVAHLPRGSDGTSALRFSDADAARLAAIAAAESAADVKVSLNWLSTVTEIPGSTVEASLGPGADFSTDAYLQDYYRSDTVAGFGVAEAWSYMWHAGVLDNRVPLAIVDAGFGDDPELAPYVAVSTVPGFDAIGPGLLAGYPHGSIAASIAMAIPDNGYGVAGVAGVVADPILILAETSIEGAMVGLLEAVGQGARIVSMSFIAPVLDMDLPLAEEFGEMSFAVRASGVLVFASSGNGGGNVDEAVRHPLLHATVPCQSPGVICVGGLEGAHSEDRHPDSTYGDPIGSVDIYAPYCVFVGPFGAIRGVSRVCGTSLSAPFAAGVAALIWASDPNLSADQVWELMQSTAAGDRWPRVQALEAVRRALDGPLRVEFIEPTSRRQDLGRAVGLVVMVTVFEEGPGSRNVALTWRSDRDGVLADDSILVSLTGRGHEHRQRASTVATGLSEGTHTITLTAMLDGVRRRATVTLDVVNSPPEPHIVQPGNGYRACPGESLTFRGEAFDINEQLGLPESAFRWRSNVDGAFGSGSTVTIATLGVGDHRVRLRVRDSHGLVASAYVNLTILDRGAPGCENLAPLIRILEPAPLTVFYVQPDDVDEVGPYAEATLRGTATDPEGQPLTIRWFSNVENPQLLGTGLEITVRLHQFGPICQAQEHRIEMRVSDGVKTASDVVRVFVNHFC